LSHYRAAVARGEFDNSWVDDHLQLHGCWVESAAPEAIGATAGTPRHTA
jgi:hypothetical protein